MRKNKNNETDLPLTISSKDGLVDQISFFNKTVASKDMSGYYLLMNGEYAYNKSYSVGYDFGSIKRLERYPMGALSTLYICFALKKHNSDFIKTYFDSLKWYKEIYMISAEGARNHGLLNVPTDEFFDTYHYLTENEKEQEKIATLINLVEHRIQKQQDLLENLKKYKRGFIELFFDDNTLRQKDEYRIVSLGEIANLRGRIGFRGYTRGDIVNKGEGAVSFSPSNIMNGFVNFEDCTYISEAKYFESPEIMVAQNDILFTKTGSTIGKIGYVKELKERATINPQIALITAHSCDPYYLFLAMSRKSASDYVRSISVGGAIPTLSQEQLKQLSIPLISIKKQEELSSFILALDERIDCAIQTLTQLNKMKIGLLQQLFV